MYDTLCVLLHALKRAAQLLLAAVDETLCLFTQALGLFFEVLGGITQIVAKIFHTPLQLAPRRRTRLWRKQQHGRATHQRTDRQCNPDLFHRQTSTCSLRWPLRKGGYSPCRGAWRQDQSRPCKTFALVASVIVFTTSNTEKCPRMNAPPRRPGPLPRPGRAPFISSGYFTPVLVALLCVVILVISWERGRGNFHRLTTAVMPPEAGAQRASGPGGEDAIRLVRTPDAVSGEPEFLSATLLPGRGMNLLQLTALIPGHGEVPLLMSPPLPEAAAMLSGTGPDVNGNLSATMGGAFLVPWAGRLAGKPSTTAGLLQTLWLGQRLTYPMSAPGSLLSTRGLLLDRSADSTHTDVILDGQSVEGIFHPGTFSGNWPSTGSVHITAELAERALDLMVSVQNTGTTPMPVGVGWLPYFNIASHDRANATLTLPSSTRLEQDHNTGIPTGRMLPVTGTPLDFASTRGTRLGSTSIDDTYTRLTTGLMASTPVIELRDTTSGYGLRVIPLSASIRGLRVIAPADKPWVCIGPETNFDDALGSQWDTAEGSGITTLQPGDSIQWKVRVEIFSFTAGEHRPAA